MRINGMLCLPAPTSVMLMLPPAVEPVRRPIQLLGEVAPIGPAIALNTAIFNRRQAEWQEFYIADAESKKVRYIDRFAGNGSIINDPARFWDIPSHFAAHNIYRFNGETVEVERRRKFDDAMVAAGVIYNGKVHFDIRRETRQMYDLLVDGLLDRQGNQLKWSAATLEYSSGSGVREQVESFIDDKMEHGIRMDVDENGDPSGTLYHVVFADIGDTKAKLFCVPADSDYKLPEDLGLILSDDPKAPKRERRGSAPYDFILKFRTIRKKRVKNGIERVIRHDKLGIEVKMLDYDMSRLNKQQLGVVDGTGACQLFGDHSFMMTVVTDEGMAKGHYHFYPQMRYAIVNYGVKPELKLTGDTVLIGSLGELRPHDGMRMDMQTLLVCGFYKKHLVPAEAERWIEGRWNKINSEDEMDRRDLAAGLIRHSWEDEEEDSWMRDEDGALQHKAPEEMWALLRAILLDVGIKVHPVLWRRFFSLLFEGAIKPERGRVPMSQFIYHFVRPNPVMFLPNGDIDLSLDELGDDLCDFELKNGAYILVGRHPIAHKHEAVKTRNRWMAALEVYRGKGFIFYGSGGGKHLNQAGGGDGDDCFWGTDDESYIAAWEGKYYPIFEKDAIEVVLTQATKRNRFAEAERQKLHPRTGRWTRQIFREQVQRWLEGGTTLGRIVNNLMGAMAMEGDLKESAMASLLAGRIVVPSNCTIEDVPSYVEDVCIPWLEYKPEYETASAAYRLEKVIDFKQMGKGDKAEVDEIADLSKKGVEDAPFYPVWYEERIPHARREAGNYILVQTEVCEGIKFMVDLKEEISEGAREIETMLARRIPKLVMQRMNVTKADHDRAYELRSSWAERIDAEKAAHKGVLPEDWYDHVVDGIEGWVVLKPGDKGYNARQASLGVPQVKKISQNGFRDEYLLDDINEPYDKEERLPVALAMFDQDYRKSKEPVKDPETRKTRHFGDGKPDVVLHDLLSAYQAAGVTGEVLYVDMDPRAKRRLTESVEVRALNGKVTQVDNGLEVGKCQMLPDGEYEMSPEGCIVVEQSIPELQSDFLQVQAEAAVECTVDYTEQPNQRLLNPGDYVVEDDDSYIPDEDEVIFEGFDQASV